MGVLPRYSKWDVQVDGIVCRVLLKREMGRLGVCREMIDADGGREGSVCVCVLYVCTAVLSLGEWRREGLWDCGSRREECIERGDERVWMV